MKMLSAVMSLLLLVLLVALQASEAKVIDIRSEAYFIVSRHNEVRRSREVDASDMLEMRWDEDLARRASNYAERCEYKRPREERINANLYFTSDHVHGERTIHKWLDSAISAWRRVRERYTFASHCGRACAYVQMIMARTDRIGCALSHCENVRAGNFEVDYGSLFVCYYYPGENLLRTYPYTRGRQCSRCDRRMECRQGLCHTPGTEIVPRELMQRNSRSKPQAYVAIREELNQEETRSLLDSHNRMRRGNRVNRDLRWDRFLERWAEWIVHCTVDYPGPKHTYTNFERMEHDTNVYDVVSKWSEEGSNINLRMEHGCRTPTNKLDKCNHFTNVLQDNITAMACASRNCDDAGRQLVCLYDNSAERPARRRTYTRPNPYTQRYTARIQPVRLTDPRRDDPRRRPDPRRDDPRRRPDPRRDDPRRRPDPRRDDPRRRPDPRRDDTRRRPDPRVDDPRRRPDPRSDDRRRRPDPRRDDTRRRTESELSYEERRRRYYERLRIERENNERRRNERI